MNRKSLSPGLAVLTLTAVLALAGVRPAAAQDLGLFTRGVQWLAALWSSPAQSCTLETGAMASRPDDNATIDKGLGVDPNGGGIVPQPPPVNGN
jgi:hypothetical protein